MDILQNNLLIAYLLITFYFFINWLKFFNQASICSVEDWSLSVITLVIATILWPFVVPITLLEMLKPQAIKQYNDSCKFKKVL